MALINCAECNNQISNQAASCPKCGAPINHAQETRNAGAQLTTTQLTSKKFKLHRLLSIITMAIGGSWLYIATEAKASPTLPALLLTIGLAWFFITKIRKWWHHD